MEKAKARFHKVVQRARTEGPQHVTMRDQGAVVVIAAEELARLLRPIVPGQPLIAFMQGLGLENVDVQRDAASGRL
ncbi:MAG TPA: type II toxin-antitoxin system prevent-host-death family antitoxin [Acetobacteraceae bacterium]